MFIIKHKTRRSSKKLHASRPNEPFYFIVNSRWSTDSLEDACEVFFEAWRDALRQSRIDSPQYTLESMYPAFNRKLA